MKILLFLVQVASMIWTAQAKKEQGDCWSKKCLNITEAGNLTGTYIIDGPNQICEDGCQYRNEHGRKFCIQWDGIYPTKYCEYKKKKEKGPWGYYPKRPGFLSPDEWKDEYPECGADKQSPININTSAVTPETQPLSFLNYSSEYETNIVMNNHGPVVTFGGSGQKPCISGGHLPPGDRFEFAGLHWHWGSDDSQGSEHKVDGTSYPAEVHLVHFNLKYGDLKSAVGHSDGLAVLGFFYESSPTNNTKIDSVISFLQSHKKSGRQGGEVDLFVNKKDGRKGGGEAIDIGQHKLEDFIPDGVGGQEQDRFTYKGSLTTPPCAESVFWNVFKAKCKISDFQLQVFRALVNTEGINLSNNYRPIQPLNGRMVSDQNL